MTDFTLFLKLVGARAHFLGLADSANLGERIFPEGFRRFDFAWPQIKFAVEVEGGIFVNGAHTRGAHFRSDCEKYAEALLLGWRVLRVEDSMIRKGRALQIIETILKESKL